LVSLGWLGGGVERISPDEPDLLPLLPECFLLFEDLDLLFEVSLPDEPDEVSEPDAPSLLERGVVPVPVPPGEGALPLVESGCCVPLPVEPGVVVSGVVPVLPPVPVPVPVPDGGVASGVVPVPPAPPGNVLLGFGLVPVVPPAPLGLGLGWPGLVPIGFVPGVPELGLVPVPGVLVPPPVVCASAVAGPRIGWFTEPPTPNTRNAALVRTNFLIMSAPPSPWRH
jgi:hypothetical protein